MFSEQQLADFRRAGYLRVRNVISANSVKDLFDSVLSAYRTYGGSLAAQSTFSGFDDPEFSLALIVLRRDAPKRFSAVYDAMLASYALQKVCFGNSIGEYSAVLLGVSPAALCFRGTMLRMDAPLDTRNVYGWHQDSSYTNYNKDGLNAIIAWCPLVPVTRHNGTLQVCEGSHLEPSAQPTGIDKGKGYSVQNLVELSVVSKYAIIDVEAEAGDVVFSYSSLVHRSGQNSSDNVRFTAIVRYHNMFSKDFHLFPKD